ncbi:UBX domain-containing protein 6 [Nasonia vitripennis]|uniref:UBX domain-containing protein n=1 Tax=Nasonia vitripennis TaxID=7425 RepID=A0A7M7GBS0_NASVI|nr:UBX domain-containing protein 6 [Nasonia vitripennis]XP_003424839.1 UBX domain-containing protein 6 [Nasonia vitripennis]
MAEKIKSFFQKKIKDEKFKHAGKGYRLNESAATTTGATTSKNVSTTTKRHEPTNEAKIAGQAALARLEGMKSSAPKLNTSYAAIQARVKKELEQEKLAVAQENVKSTSSAAISQAPILAVSGVYYRCPLVSEEVLDKETWYDRIQEFFSSQLSDDEAGLSACLIIHSCNDGADEIRSCVDILCKYLDNIRNDPVERKYWKIRMSNRIFKENVKKLRGTMEFLKAAGFAEEKLMHQEREEDFLVWSPERCSIDNLTTLVDALQSAESVQLLLDRNVQVLLPSQAAERSELPAEFYSLSAEDIKREQTERAKAVERNQMLMTQAMREKLMKDKERKYRFTLIRIRFPDGIILQGTFAVDEKFEQVVEFVKENLLNEQFPFYLITATREKLTEVDFEKSLESLNLVPAVVLTFFWDSAAANAQVPSQCLKEETLSLLQSM